MDIVFITSNSNYSSTMLVCIMVTTFVE